ncbi:hypothetical protein RJ55_06771 [Drechmeria coniospora]|nr:hypothetical protein RJ55_06771 [Drechmeria coniospora]
MAQQKAMAPGALAYDQEVQYPGAHEAPSLIVRASRIFISYCQNHIEYSSATARIILLRYRIDLDYQASLDAAGTGCRVVKRDSVSTMAARGNGQRSIILEAANHLSTVASSSELGLAMFHGAPQSNYTCAVLGRKRIRVTA